MHELGLVYEMARTVTNAAERNGIEHVRTVTVDCGEASGVLPDVFQEYYPYVARQFPVMADSTLDLRIIPAMASCMDCCQVYRLMPNEGICPVCQSRLKTVLTGKDIMIQQIEA